MNLYDLKSHHHILSCLECSAIFDDDGSVEYKEFIKQFERYQMSSYFLNNDYIFQIIKNGIGKYANANFWEEFYSD